MPLSVDRFRRIHPPGRLSSTPWDSHDFTKSFVKCKLHLRRRLSLRFQRVSAAAQGAVFSSTDVPSICKREEKGPLLEMRHLQVVATESKQKILHDVNLTILEGEVHAIMGKNGSGKSTLAKVLVGHPGYEVTNGTIQFKGKNLLDMEPEERSLDGLFMSFQSPIEIPGVSNSDFLMMAYNSKRKKLGEPEIDPIKFWEYIFPKIKLVNMDAGFLNRNVNEGFSGGERKRNEILQLTVLGADLAILDEVDSGLDVDALRDVAKAVNNFSNPRNSLLMITHYRRLLDLVCPTHVHIMENGHILRTGDISLAEAVEGGGYQAISG